MKKHSSFAAFAAISLLGLPASAAVIGQLGILQDTANGGINPATGVAWAAGDSYRLIFVTSTTTLATSTDISTYNSFVQGVADAAGLGGATWKIVGSTEDVDARDNTGTNPTLSSGVPVLLMNGTSLFAADNTDLWDGANVAVQFDESGTDVGSLRVFTGSTAGGVEEAGAGQFLGSTVVQSNGNVVVRTGGTANTGGTWMRVFSDSPDGARSVYAMSDPLTVIPEPSAALLGAIGAVMLLRRRR